MLKQKRKKNFTIVSKLSTVHLARKQIIFLFSNYMQAYWPTPAKIFPETHKNKAYWTK